METAPKPEESIPYDIVRTVALLLVVIAHAAAEPSLLQRQFSTVEAWAWWVANIYDSFARVCVPLFVILSGALLLDPLRSEPLKIFFKKRLMKVGIPLLFWGGIYFAYRYFVNHEALVISDIWRGFLEGYPYYHFWFLYVIIGLYLITPALLPIIANAERKILTYLIVLWFFGTAVAPTLRFFGIVRLNTNLFVFPSWVGYFVLGAYLKRAKVPNWLSFGTYILASVWTAIGTYSLTIFAGGQFQDFFYDLVSINVAFASTGMFLFLVSFSSKLHLDESSGFLSFVRWIRKNSLPIYLLHIMILERLQHGLIGIKISVTTLNPVLEIPLISIITIAVCVMIISLLRKVPILNKVIG